MIRALFLTLKLQKGTIAEVLIRTIPNVVPRNLTKWSPGRVECPQTSPYLKGREAKKGGITSYEK